MNQIYLFEIFVDQLIFMKDIENTEIVANVTGGSLLDIYVYLAKAQQRDDPNKSTNSMAEKYYKGGKSVFFSSTPAKVIEALESNLKVTINTAESKEEFGSTMLHWNSQFKKEVTQLTGNIKNIRQIEHYEIICDGTKIAKLDLNMLLLCYGETIELSVANMTSATATIPVMIPKYGNAKQTTKGSAAPTDPWASLFNSPYKERRSVVDVELMLYAQMAGIVTDEILEDKRLSVEYINNHLCGHKSCPGAIKFRDWGIGPLASPKSGLGTIGSLTGTKTTGLYGMSQAYGTLNPYGAYGLFVNTGKEAKTKCNSPTCPYTDLDEMEKVNAKTKAKADADAKKANADTEGDADTEEEEEERLIGQSLDEKLEESCCIQNKNKSVKCTCKCCGKKYVKRFPSTCGDPLCPSMPKKRTHVCKGPVCPHTGPDDPSRIDCGGEVCPAFEEDDPTCQGEICPYSKANVKKCCVTDTCPREAARRLRGGADSSPPLPPPPPLITYKKCRCCNRLMRRKPKLTNMHKRKIGGADDCDSDCINADGSYIYEYGAASTRNWRSQSNLPNSCTDPNCQFKHIQDQTDKEAEPQTMTIADFDDLTTTDSSWGKPPPAKPTKPTCTTFSPETCIIKKCQIDTEGGKRHEYEYNKAPENDAKIKRLTRLVNEARQNLLVSNGGNRNLDADTITKGLLNTKHLLSDVVSFEEDDDEMIYLIARLLGERDFSLSMNNLYMDDYFNECRLKERNDLATKRNDEPSGGNDDLGLLQATPSPSKQNQQMVARVKQKRRGPCQKDTCNYMKYKMCSECGGVSKSGATCDNSDVSFSYISYSDVAEESIDEGGERHPHPDRKQPNIGVTNDNKMTGKQQGNTDRKHVKHQKKRKNRFIYNCGENYPGIRLGHKYCRVNERDKNNVPFDMGWLWNVKPEGIRRRRKNWRPGMINTIINDRILEYRKKRGIPDPPQLKMIVPTKKKQRNHNIDDEIESSDDEIMPKPTLVIQKKEGSYLITLNPLKDPKTLAPFENPYMECKPMQFVITRPPKPQGRKRKDAAEGELDDGGYEDYDECLCNKDDDDHACSSSSSSDSELNIEFTTPAGLIYPEEMRRPPNVIHTETQFKEADFNCTDCPIILPKKFSKRGKSKQKKK